MRFLVILLLSLSLGACAHEAENTGQKNSSSTITLPATYAMQTRSSSVEEPVAAGRISRFERKTIVPGGMDGVMNPCGKSLDATLDHLEELMAPQIRQNNEIAAKQASARGYRF